MTDLDDDEFFMLLVLSNAQGELSALEWGIHIFSYALSHKGGRGRQRDPSAPRARGGYCCNVTTVFSSSVCSPRAWGVGQEGGRGQKKKTPYGRTSARGFGA